MQSSSFRLSFPLKFALGHTGKQEKPSMSAQMSRYWDRLGAQWADIQSKSKFEQQMVDVFLKRARNNKKNKFGGFSSKTSFLHAPGVMLGECSWSVGEAQAESEQQTLKN